MSLSLYSWESVAGEVSPPPETTISKVAAAVRAGALGPGAGGGGGEGGGGRGGLGLNHARMCVSNSEGNGFFFGFK